MNHSKDDMEAISVDIRNASWRELYLLHYKQQIIVAIIAGIILFIALYWLLVSSLVNRLSVEKNREESLRQTYSENINKLAGIPVLEQEIEMIKKSSAKLLSQLPSDFSVASVVQEFYEAGAKNGLRINVNKHLAVREEDTLTIRPYEIETTGSYHQLAKFCLALGKLDSLVILTNFRLSVVQNQNQNQKNTDKEILQLKVIANTYQARE